MLEVIDTSILASILEECYFIRDAAQIRL